MNGISGFKSQEIFLTQGANETYTAYNCRVWGFRITRAEPDTFLRRMSSGSSNNSQGSFKGHFGYASALKERYSLPGEGTGAAQPYYFYMDADTPKQASTHNNDRAGQALNQQTGIQSRYWETSDKPKKTVFQQLLNFLTRCFMPCIKVKT